MRFQISFLFNNLTPQNCATLSAEISCVLIAENFAMKIYKSHSKIFWNPLILQISLGNYTH